MSRFKKPEEDQQLKKKVVGYLRKDDSTEGNEQFDASRKSNDSVISANIDTETKFINNSQISLKYHKLELKTNKKLIKNLIRLCWLGGVTLSFCALLCLTCDADKMIIPLLSGAITEFISGTLIFLVNLSFKYKYRSFEINERHTQVQQLIKLANQDDLTELAQKIILKAADNLYKNENNNK